MFRKIILFTFILICLATGFAFYKVYYSIENWRYQGLDQIFEIKKGESFSQINFHLGQQRLISSKKIFYQYAKINGLLTSFKAGKYLIKTNSNMKDVINTLVNGTPMLTKLTVPEGKNLFEIGKILNEYNICNYDEFVTLGLDKDFVSSLGIKAQRIEGYLYPETYLFPPGTPAKQIIIKMVETFKKKISGLDFSKTFLNLHEVITLASIVEKETGAPFERAKIAGVFVNRLKKRMRLQTDPTIIYGMFEEFGGNIQLKDKKHPSPYNTYMINGLPIGPIANPGIASIKAALEPETHTYLYFVSKNDGTHEFSSTLIEHNLKVEQFQKNYYMRQGKSWRDLNLKSNKTEK